MGGSQSGAPISIIRQYLEQQNTGLEKFNFSNHPTTSLNLSTRMCVLKF